MQKSSLIKQALYSWQPPIDNVTSTSPTSERLFHPHHTSDLIPSFLAQLTRQLQNLLKLPEFTGGRGPLSRSLSRSPTHTLSRSPTCPPLDLQCRFSIIFLCIRNPYSTKSNPITCAGNCNNDTSTNPPRNDRNRVFAGLIPINFPDSAVFTAHYPWDC